MNASPNYCKDQGAGARNASPLKQYHQQCNSDRETSCVKRRVTHAASSTPEIFGLTGKGNARRVVTLWSLSGQLDDQDTVEQFLLRGAP